MAALTLAPRKCIISSAGALCFDFHAATVGRIRRHLGFLALVCGLIRFKGAAASRPHAISLALCAALALQRGSGITWKWRVGMRLNYCNLCVYGTTPPSPRRSLSPPPPPLCGRRCCERARVNPAERDESPIRDNKVV